MGGGKGGGQTIGYWYDLDLLATLCHGKVDADTDFELTELRFGDRTAWQGLVTQSGTISVYKSELFGGETREGGVNGQIDIMMGTLTQPVNEFLGTSVRLSGITGDVPAYRGEMNLFFRGVTAVNPEFAASGIFVKTPTTPPFNFTSIFGKPILQPRAFRWSAMNPYFKPFKALLGRYWKGWYPTKARIGDQANAAHIIVESINNSEWGMGYPLADLDLVKCQDVADTLYDEGFGLGLIWRQQTSIQEFLNLVLQHINAVINTDRTTGKLFPRLIRNDYDVETLLELNPSNSMLESYSRPTFGETVNEITLKFTTPEGTTDAVTVHDLASITSNQSQIVNQTIELPGIQDAALAARIAQRELDSRSKPICKLSIITNRIAFNLYEGEVFKFSWPEHGIEQMICRVVDVDLGSLQNNVITIEAIEDVFGLPLASYVNPQPGGWIDPTSQPIASPLRYITETPYYDLARGLSEADLATVDPTDCFVDVFAKEPSRDALDYNLWTASGSADVEQRGTGSHSPVATLTVAAIKEESSVLTLSDITDIIASLSSENEYVVINGEYSRITDYNATANTLTVDRGVLDTVPKDHAIGSNVFLGDDNIGRDRISYVSAETVKVRVQTKTSQGVLDITVAPQDTYTFLGRQYRPYPPGQFRVNTLAYPANIDGVLTVTYATRNRLTQLADMVAQGFGSITPEVGTTHRLRIYNGLTLVRTYSGVVTTTITYATDDAVADGCLAMPRLVLDSQRDGVDSWQPHDLTVTRYGLGFQLGNRLGGTAP